MNGKKSGASLIAGTNQKNVRNVTLKKQGELTGSKEKSVLDTVYCNTDYCSIYKNVFN